MREREFVRLCTLCFPAWLCACLGAELQVGDVFLQLLIWHNPFSLSLKTLFLSFAEISNRNIKRCLGKHYSNSYTSGMRDGLCVWLSARRLSLPAFPVHFQIAFSVCCLPLIPFISDLSIYHLSSLSWSRIICSLICNSLNSLADQHWSSGHNPSLWLSMVVVIMRVKPFFTNSPLPGPFPWAFPFCPG